MGTQDSRQEKANKIIRGRRRMDTALEPLAVNLGIPLDQDSFIENKERAGYRLNPGLREVDLADIRTAIPPPPQCA